MPVHSTSGRIGGIAVDPSDGASGDSFKFLDTSESKRSPGLAGGVFVSAGDLDGPPHHTPEWADLRAGDPTSTPAQDDAAGLLVVDVRLDDHAGTLALY